MLVRLSENLEDWDVVGFYLELEKAEITAIRKNNSTEEAKRICTLTKWKEKKGSGATYYNLIECIAESKRNSLVDQALDFLKESK